jgi:hypothetical protein
VRGLAAALLLVASASLLVVGGEQAAQADCGGIEVGVGGHGAGESGTCTTDGTDPVADDGAPAQTPVGPWTKTLYVEECSGATLPDGSEPVSCPPIPCTGEDELPYFIYEQPMNGTQVAGQVVFTGEQCMAPGEAQAPVITPEMVVDAARQVAPEPVAQVQPGNRSYVNVPNNYWSEDTTETIDVNVAGTAIGVTFLPTGDTWDFGDGAGATGSGVKDADLGAAGAVEHPYARAGSYPIHVTRTYTVRFTLPGGPVTVDNAFSITGPDTVLPVGEIQTRVDSTS